MKWPWSKSRQQRGQYKTAKQRLVEQKDLVDELMIKSWLEDLRTHPNYLREVARQKFGLSGIGGGDEEADYKEPSFVDQLLDVKKAKGALDSMFGQQGGQQPQGLMAQLPEIMRAMPEFAAGLQALMASGVMNQMRSAPGTPALQPPQEEPHLLEEKEPKMPQEERLTLYAEEFLALTPEEAALRLYESKDVSNRLESFVWNSILGLTPDDVLAMIPLLESSKFAYLVPLAKEMFSPEKKQWLSLLIDECAILNSPISEPTSPEISVKSNETTVKPRKKKVK